MQTLFAEKMELGRIQHQLAMPLLARRAKIDAVAMTSNNIHANVQVCAGGDEIAAKISRKYAINKF